MRTSNKVSLFEAVSKYATVIYSVNVVQVTSVRTSSRMLSNSLVCLLYHLTQRQSETQGRLHGLNHQLHRFMLSLIVSRAEAQTTTLRYWGHDR